jgi:hypothetical protein
MIKLLICLCFQIPSVNPGCLLLFMVPLARWHNIYYRGLECFLGPVALPGDFNFIVSGGDKKGGGGFVASSSRGLGNLLNQNDMIDLGFSENPFTWCNRRTGLANINLFTRATIFHHPTTSSDHNPLLLNACGLGKLQASYPKPFRFEGQCPGLYHKP